MKTKILMLAMLAIILLTSVFYYINNLSSEIFTTEVKHFTPPIIDFYLKPEDRVVIVRRGECVESYIHIISGASGCRGRLVVAGEGQDFSEVLHGLGAKMPQGLSAILKETTVDLKPQSEVKIPLIITASKITKPGIYTVEVTLYSDEAHGGHTVPIEIIVEE